MRAYTWTDKALTRHAGRFVWLSLDMEKAVNAPARKQIGITAFPTLYVVDPSDGHVAIRWLGGASIAQLERLFDDGELAVKGGAKGPALEALIAADRAYGAEKFADACTQYNRALSLAPANWPAYNRAVESLLSAYSESDSNEATCRVADAVWPRVKGTISSANVASYALSAAVAMPDSIPQRQFLVLNTRADIQLGMGDKSAAQKTLTDALAKAEAMPEGQRSDGTIKNFKTRIAKLNAGTD